MGDGCELRPSGDATAGEGERRHNIGRGDDGSDNEPTIRRSEALNRIRCGTIIVEVGSENRGQGDLGRRRVPYLFRGQDTIYSRKGHKLARWPDGDRCRRPVIRSGRRERARILGRGSEATCSDCDASRGGVTGTA